MGNKKHNNFILHQKLNTLLVTEPKNLLRDGDGNDLKDNENKLENAKNI